MILGLFRDKRLYIPSDRWTHIDMDFTSDWIEQHEQALVYRAAISALVDAGKSSEYIEAYLIRRYGLSKEVADRFLEDMIKAGIQQPLVR